MSMNNERMQTILDDYTPSHAGRTRAGQGRILSTHIPVRFSPIAVAQLRELAARDGVTVSSWVRNLVEREIKSQLPHPESVASSWLLAPHWSEPTDETAVISSNSHADLIPALTSR